MGLLPLKLNLSNYSRIWSRTCPPSGVILLRSSRLSLERRHSSFVLDMLEMVQILRSGAMTGLAEPLIKPLLWQAMTRLNQFKEGNVLLPCKC